LNPAGSLLPRSAQFAQWVLEEAGQVPKGRGYRFEPGSRPRGSDLNPRDPHHDGVSRDLFVGQVCLGRSAEDGATYCCGVTLEVFIRAWGRWCDAQSRPAGLAHMSPSQMHAFVSTWFCPQLGDSGAVEALVSSGLGFRVDADKARPGDFCQFWRSTDRACASGHSVIFLGWEEVEGSCIRYWSSQSVTRGVGEHHERVGVDWVMAFARAGSED
jgi:hypothetical protein